MSFSILREEPYAGDTSDERNKIHGTPKHELRPAAQQGAFVGNRATEGIPTETYDQSSGPVCTLQHYCSKCYNSGS
ncbi:uncharacterized protein EAE97_011282 [Botrytis byssoidea]|uniref:Uncharacterized protein n=1 Tax=Botrytis byssoidea TaxID=139641 RepID=A0A9P5HSE0_9HELO|nr:uncharacterized protein EAE97_011282 [Botrytis byssoidea]KAF7921493.1 hypothetical protein EAE97_011282 [Botrytis byssoidea]